MKITFSASFSAPRRRGIPLTPLIDVVFILLVFFMLASQFTQLGLLALGLPQESADSSRQEPITLTLTQDGTIFLDQEPISRNALKARLSAWRAAQVPVIVAIAPKTPLQETVALLHLLKPVAEQVLLRKAEN